MFYVCKQNVNSGFDCNSQQELTEDWARLGRKLSLIFVDDELDQIALPSAPPLLKAVFHLRLDLWPFSLMCFCLEKLILAF